MLEEVEKPLKLQKYFVQQIAMEQEFLMLTENQRNAIRVLLSPNGQMNEYELRVKVYYEFIKPELFSAQYSLSLAFMHKISQLFEDRGYRPIYFQGETNNEEEFGAVFVKLLEERFQKPLKKFEMYLKVIAKELNVHLPSNVLFTKELEELVRKKRFVKKSPKSKMKRAEYTIDPNFHKDWTKTRMSIIDSIKKGNISPDYLTETSCSFWKIE